MVGQRLIGMMLVMLYSCFLLTVQVLPLSQRTWNEQVWSSPEQRNCCSKWLLWEDDRHWKMERRTWSRIGELRSNWVISFPCPIFCIWLCVENSPTSLSEAPPFSFITWYCFWKRRSLLLLLQFPAAHSLWTRLLPGRSNRFQSDFRKDSQGIPNLRLSREIPEE